MESVLTSKRSISYDYLIVLGYRLDFKPLEKEKDPVSIVDFPRRRNVVLELQSS